MPDAPNAPGAPGAAPPSATAPAPRTAVGNRVDFSASLDSFQGPLDLLLYLIKENEVEITEIPIARILEQYLRFLDEAPQWDLQLAGEFLVMAATLMEIKSRELLPVQAQPAEGEEIIDDPRTELVRQLLQYRTLKDQARTLETLQHNWEQLRPRGFFGDVPEPSDEAIPDSDRATAREALIEVDLYALFAAYERTMKSVLAQTPRAITYDGESIEAKIERIEVLLKSRPFARFVELIANPNDRGDIAATFVALLELTRRRAVKLTQAEEYGLIDINASTESEAEAAIREQSTAAEKVEQEALRVKAEQDAKLLAEGGMGATGRPAFLRKAPRVKFAGLIKPEDLEEIDTEEHEIGRRIDAILAAADAISERFEQSREGRVRGDENVTPPAEASATPAEPAPEAPAATPDTPRAPTEPPPESPAKPDATQS